MRMTLKGLLGMLGVSHVLYPYETVPWSVYDEARGRTCSAEVRMGPEGEDTVEAEIQMVYDDPPPGRQALEQLLWLRATPHTVDKWAVINVRIKGESYVNKVYNWQEKCANLFHAVIEVLEKDQIPDFDELLAKEVTNRERQSDKWGSGGGKSPKIKPGQLMDIKQGGGF